MIDVVQKQILDERQIWSGCVRRLLTTVEIEPHETSDAIAESLAVFCQGRTQIQQRELSLLTARAFCAAGDSTSAEKILYHERTYRPHTGSWLQILSARYPFPELHPLFSSRALRPLQLASAGTLWIFDFAQIHFHGAERHELILFQTVRRLIEKISCVWNESDGGGTLGIKNFSRLSGAAGEEQLLEYIRDVLNFCARKNKWNAVPELLLIDL